MKMGRCTASEKTDAIGSDIFRTAGHTEVTGDAFGKKLTRLSKVTIGGESNRLLYLNSLRTGHIASTTVATMFGLWEDFVELALNLPGAGNWLKIVGVA